MRRFVCATSERRDGPMGAADGPVPNSVMRNRTGFLRRLGIPHARLVRVRQVHGNSIFAVGKKISKRIPKADGMITHASNAFLGILTADCVPIFFWDRDYSVVGIAHAGWRGVVKGIATKMVLQFRSSGISPRSLRVVIGPAIQKCHFEIWPDTRHKGLRPFIRSHRSLLKKKKLLIEKNGRIFLDLPGVLYEELIRAGIPGSHIRSTGECTFHLSRHFFSYRRKTLGGRDQFGNMLSVIGIRN